MFDKRARAQACKNCRMRKRRCIPTVGAESCQYCNALSIPCSLILNRSDRSTKAVVSPTENSISRGRPDIDAPSQHWMLIPEKHLLTELVTLYFRLIHNTPHTLFHEATFLAELDAGLLPDFLVLAVIALSARFCKNKYFEYQDPRSRGKIYAENAMRTLNQKLIQPTLETVQASILMAHYLGGEGDVKGKHIYVGVARLHSLAIDIRETATKQSRIVSEVQRRTWLSVVISENWSAADMSTQPMIAENHCHGFQLIEDIDFAAMRPEQDGSLPPQPSEKSMWAQMAKTISLFRRINEMLLGLCSKSTSIQSYTDEIRDLERQLDHWANKLPANLTYTKSNFEFYARAGFGRTFLSMHLGHHHFRQLLYYPFLDPRQYLQQLPQSGQAHYRQLCKANASVISDIADLSFRTPECNLVYFLTGHILVVSSSVHLHTLLLSEDPGEAERARERLVSNFEILMELKLHWPVIDISVARLRIFQNGCRLQASGSFALDNWMLKFLLEHTASLGSGDRPTSSTAPPFGDENGTAGSLEHGTTDRLSQVLESKDMSNEIMVDNALEWLLN